MSKKAKRHDSDPGLPSLDSELGDGEVLPEDPRRRARWAAVQALYEWDTSGHDAVEAATHRLEDDPAPERVRDLALSLVSGVRGQQREVDAVLSRAAPQWRVEQMAA